MFFLSHERRCRNVIKSTLGEIPLVILVRSLEMAFVTACTDQKTIFIHCKFNVARYVDR